MKMINFLDEKYGTEFYAHWGLFEVTDSAYLEWFNQESYNIYKCCDIKHYVFITPNDIIDILSTYEPTINIIK